MWQKCAALQENALEFYEVVSFGPGGLNLQLSSKEDEGDTLTIATRTSGLVNGVVLTSELPAMPAEVEDADAADGSAKVSSESSNAERYYFKVQVLEVSEKRTNRTMSLGFAWRLPHAMLEDSQEAPDSSAPSSSTGSRAQFRRASSWVTGGMPENASGLPRSFILGGDLPKAYLGGREIAKVTGWRPLLDVVPGSTIGALIEVHADDRLRLSIFQDEIYRCSVEATLPEDWRWPALGAPNGVVDVCGMVTSAALCQGASPPKVMEAEDAARGGSPEKGAAEATDSSGYPS